MPSAFPSALSAQHFVTAAQYNNMLSGLITMPMVPSAVVSNVFTPVSGRYEALMMTRPSGRHNYMVMTYIGPMHLVAGGASPGNPASSMAYTLINFNPNLISYKYPSASGTWNSGPFSATATVDGDTGNALGASRTLNGLSTATITGVTYLQWDLGSIITGTIYWNIAGAMGGLAATGSAILRVSNDGTTYTLITAYKWDGAGNAGSAGISASVPMRYIQASINVYAPVGQTAKLLVSEIAVYTSSAFYNVNSGQPTWETLTANITGNLISLYTTAPTPIEMEFYTANPAWRLQA